MRKLANRILFLAIASFLGSNLQAQVSLYLETFETDGEGSRYTSNTYNLASPTCDFFQRESVSPINPCFGAPTFTGFRGNFFWGSEDVKASPGTRPIGTVTSSTINIAGYTSLQASFYVATSFDNTTRWETDDKIEVQVSINGAAFQTVGRFMGNGTAPGTSLYRDTNLNNTIDPGELTPIISVPTFTKYTFSIPGSGSTLQVRVSLDQLGGSEEFGFDDLEVTGVAPSCTPPTITCPSTQSLALNAFCQATLVDYTSLATVTGNCSPTVTQSPAIGSTVSGAGAMTVSLFATNTLLQSATCTFTVNKTSPEVEVRGNSNIIADGDSSPSTTDHTDFGSVLTCTGTITRTFTINNLTGTFGRTLNVGTVTVGGTHASDFTVTAQPASTVAVGSSTTITVVFNPSANGVRSATLSFTTDDCDENPFNFSIQGVGNADVVDPTIICPATQSLLLNSSCQANLPDYTGLATGVTDNCPGSPTITQSPAIGSTQSGVGPLTVSLFATDGSLNSHTCTFTVNKVSPEIAVSGNATTIADGDITPALSDHTEFGTVIVSNNLVRTYTITNSGTGDLILSAGAITVSGGNAADFVVGGITLPLTIGPSLSTTFTVTFTPSATGLRTTTLNIANNDCDENPYNYAIQGTGQPASPEMNLKSAAVNIVDGDVTPSTTDNTDFGSVATCTGTITKTFIIENVTGADLTVGTITISGANASDFTVTVFPAGTVTAGNSTPFILSFDPSANGLRTATISIANNDPDENPYDFAVQGTGDADVTNPTITCPSNITISNSTGLCAATAVYTAPVGTDNCPSPTTTQIAGLASGATYPVGVTTNTFRVTDGAGNTATCSFTVTVNDGELPVLANLSCQSSNATGAAYGDGWQNGDNDGAGFGAWTLNASTGNTGQAGFFIGSSTTNGAGTDTNTDNDINTTGVAWGMYANSAQATEAIRSITGNLTVGRRLTLEFDNGFVDPGQIVGFQLQNSSGGSLSEMRFRGGQATYEIVDVNGITAFASIPFTDEGLIIEVTPITTGTCNIKLTRKVNGATQTLLSVLNPGGGNQVISRFKVFNSNAGTGTTNNLLINSAQVCTGTPGCPVNVSVNNTPGLCSATATYNTVIAGDNCSQSLPVTQTAGLASGATFPVGVTTNIFRATDLSGNSATCSFTVTVVDNQLPTITCPSNASLNNTSGQCSATFTYTAPTGADNCAGSTTSQTAGLASGASFPVGVTTNVFRVTDASGNTATCSFTVTVTDNQLPSITCPANISVNNTSGQCNATVSFTNPVGTDNCAGPITVQTAGLASGASYPVGVTTNTFRVTDASGNSATCSFTVTVVDNEVPSITCPANISVNNTSGQCSGTTTFTAPVGSDNCPGATTTQTAGLGSGATYPIGTTNNTFTVTDAVGNTATCSFTVTVSDIELPTITCPSNASLNATSGQCSATFTYTAPVGSDNCAGSTTTQTAGLASGAAFPAGVTTNTFRVTDASGNSATCSFTVTVTDNQAPTITCPANASLNATSGQCNATFTYTAPTGADNCAGSTTTQIAGLASGSAFPVGVTTNTFRVTDASGNTATCSFTVTVTDNQLPTITCPSNMSVNNTPGQCAATVTFTAPVGSDNCPGATTSQTAGLASGATFPIGVTTNTFRVTDASGNTATCSFTVTVTDNQAPIITCPANISLNNTTGQCSAIATYTAPVGADNCPGATTTQIAGLASGATYPIGVTTNTFRATDAVGNTSTCSFTVTVTDNELPSITCPANASVNATLGSCSATFTYTAPVGSDNCPGPVTTQTSGLASGATFPAGVTTNTFRVTDASGNSATCAFTVTVVDNQAPAITCPPNGSVNATSGQCSATFTYTAPTGTDNCAGATTTQIAGLASGATYPVGVTTNVFRVTDASGNTATCSFTVTVVDNQAPTITCPSNISVNNTSGQCSATTTYTAPTGTDNCAGSTTSQTAGLASGATFPVGVTTNVFRVTDASGNTATCSFTVTVIDNQLPSITCPSNVSVNSTSGLCSATVTFTAPTGADNCAGPVTTQIAGLASGATFPVGVTTNTFRVTDASGNTATCSFTVTVVDNQLPSITCPANVSVSATTGQCNATVTYTTPSGTDNCPGTSVTQTAGLASGATFPVGVTNNVFRVTDASGNTATCAFTVTVTDNQLPAIACPSNISVNNTVGQCAATVTYTAPVGNDNCPGSSTTQIAGLSSGASYPVGVTTNTFRVTDAGGNTATCSFTVTVSDVQAPAITCPSNISVNNTPGLCAATVTYSTPSGTDNCPGATTSQIAGLSSGASYPVGVTTNTFRVTDAAGNTTTCSFTVTVNDNQAPTITCPSNISVNNTPGQCSATVTYTAPTGTDNCSGSTTTQTVGLASGSTFPVGVTTNTFRVTDASGNTASCSFTVTVVDNQLPTITCPSNISVNAASGQCNATVTYTAPVGADNCAGSSTTQTTGLASGASFPTGVTTNTFRVTDASGNTATCAFTVTVIDNQGPTITCPANISTNNAPGFCSATATYSTPVGADNCAGSNTTQTVGLSSGSSFPVGVTTNTFRVTDASGNTATCSFTVTVIDNQLPTITCPSNISVNNATGQCAANVTYSTPAGADNCPGQSTSLIAGLASGASFPVGVTTNTFRVTDAAGNTATCSFTVTVTDNQLPVITCPSNLSVNNTPGQCQAAVTYSTPSGTDNCSGQTTTQIAGLASGSNFPVGVTTNTFRVVDASGNSASCSFTVTVNDNQLPAITCPANISSPATTGLCAAVISYSTPSGSDNCPGQTTTQTAGLASGASFPVGVTTNTFRVVDAAGNSSTCSFTVTIIDNQAPAITCPANVNVNNTPGQCSAPVTYTAPVGSDNCAGSTTVQTTGLASGSNFPVGVTTNTFRATDASGNSTTCTFTVTVTDNQLPTITCPSNVTVNNAVGQCAANVVYSTPSGADNCPAQTTILTAGLASGSSFPVGVTTNTYRVTDASGNSATCSFTVTVIDNQLPTITCPANITVGNTLNQCSAAVTYTTPAGADNCPSQVTTQTAGLASGSVFPVGTTANTFLVVDASGNSASCSFNVTVNDVQAPNAICQNITVQLNNLGNGSTNTAAINNGSNDNCGVSTLALNNSNFTCSNVGPNNVTMTVTDIHGNTSTCVSVVTVADTVHPTATCQNITVHLDANGQAVVTGSMLNNGSADACGIGTLTATPSSFNCANVGTNISTLTVTDVNGNTSICNSTVIVLDSLDPVLTCPSNQVLPADSSICGAIANWAVPQPTDNCTIDTLMGSHTSGSVFTSGTTSVTYVVQDVNGNSSSCSFTVTVNVGTLQTTLTSTMLGCGYHVACAGDTTASIDSYVMGGCLPYTYAWSNGSTAGTLSNLGAGVYTVTVTDLQGSTSTASLTITEPAPLTLAIVGDTLVCDGDSTGTLVGIVAGGQSCAAYNYLWSTGSTADNLTGLPAGTYTLSVTDTLGCAAMDTAVLQLGINPILELGADTAACPGSSVLFEAPPIYAAYQWNTGSQNSVITMTTPGLYICQVWTAQGCTDIDSVSLIEHVVDNNIITPLGSLNICAGDTLILEGDAGLTNYSWSTGETTQSIAVFGAGGTFTLTAIDSNGCTASDAITVNYTPFTDPHPVITPGPNVPLCDGGSLQLDVQSGYFAYEWSTGSTAQNIVVNAPGIYTCTVSNGFGCTDVSDPVNVYSVPLPSPTIVFNPPYLSTTVSYVSYQWMIGGVPIPGAIGSLYEPLAAGWYSVSVVDSNGCAGNSSDLYVNPVGIAEEVEGIEGLVLYPNPSMGVVNLRTLNPIDWPMEVEIWDMYGKKVASFQMAHLMDVMAFDLSNLSAGSYNMKITSFRRNKTQQAVLRFVME